MAHQSPTIEARLRSVELLAEAAGLTRAARSIGSADGQPGQSGRGRHRSRQRDRGGGGPALAGAGWTVVLAGRRLATLEQTAGSGPDPSAYDPVVCDVTDEASVRALFDTAVARHGRVDLLFNNAGSGAPAGEIDEITLAEWQAVVDVNLTGAFLCTREAFRVMRRAGPAGRPDHQQRLDLGARAAAALDRLHRDQARDHRPDQVDRARRPRVRHRLRPDRHRQRGHRHDRRDDRRACSRPTAASGPSRGWTSTTSARAVVYMASLPLDANVVTLTVMATKMPFVGRG